MRWCLPLSTGFIFALAITLLTGTASPTSAQSNAVIERLVVDRHRTVIPGVTITARNAAIGFERITTSDTDGRYTLAALPVGEYVVTASATGFKKQVIEHLTVEVGRRITQNFQLEAGDISEQVSITSANDIIDRSMALGHVSDRHIVQTIPLNGRYFLDLALLVPASVTPPQGAFSALPMRGLGLLAFNGVSNTLRPDVDGLVQIFGEVDGWFDTSAFAAVPRFGNLDRNVIVGPGFNNTDVSLIKNTYIGEDLRLQFRAEVFDVFNHPNFDRPGNVVGRPLFGRISSTRFPTGESGSSRQIQFALKLGF